MEFLNALSDKIKTIKNIIADKHAGMEINDINAKYDDFSEKNANVYTKVLYGEVTDTSELEAMFENYSKGYDELIENDGDRLLEADFKFSDYIAERFLYPNGVPRASKEQLDQARKRVIKQLRNQEK